MSFATLRPFKNGRNRVRPIIIEFLRPCVLFAHLGRSSPDARHWPAVTQNSGAAICFIIPFFDLLKRSQRQQRTQSLCGIGITLLRPFRVFASIGRKTIVNHIGTTVSRGLTLGPIRHHPSARRAIVPSRAPDFGRAGNKQTRLIRHKPDRLCLVPVYKITFR